MSEPRDKGVSASAVRDFYQQACDATQAVDPRTPCLVGPGSYYKLYNMDSTVLLDSKNVIYTFDYFEPMDFSFGKNEVPCYPANYSCGVLYPGWVAECCPGKDPNVQEAFDVNWCVFQFSFVAFICNKQNG